MVMNRVDRPVPRHFWQTVEVVAVGLPFVFLRQGANLDMLPEYKASGTVDRQFGARSKFDECKEGGRR